MQPFAITGAIMPPDGTAARQNPAVGQNERHGEATFADAMLAEEAGAEERDIDESQAQGALPAVARIPAEPPRNQTMGATDSEECLPAASGPSGSSGDVKSLPEAEAEPSATGAAENRIMAAASSGESRPATEGPSLAQQAVEAQLDPEEGNKEAGSREEQRISEADAAFDAQAQGTEQDRMPENDGNGDGTQSHTVQTAGKDNMTAVMADQSGAFITDAGAAPSAASTPVNTDVQQSAAPVTMDWPAGFQTAQIADGIVTRGSDRIDIALKPEELGRLHLSMAEENGQLRITLAAERPETLDLMRRTAESLVQDLRTAGYEDVILVFDRGLDGAFEGAAGDQGRNPHELRKTPPDEDIAAAASPAAVTPGLPAGSARTAIPGSIDLRF